MGALSQISEAYFGGPTRQIFREVTVATTVTELLPENPDRLAWAVMNRSANFGAFGFRRDVTTATGFRLGAATGFASKDYRTDGETAGYAVFALNDTLAGTWVVEEVIREFGEQPTLAPPR